MSKDSLLEPRPASFKNQPANNRTNKNGVPEFKQKVTKLDVKIDNQVKYEFGGPVGVTAMMLGFPCLMYYFWVCLEFHQGRLIYPSDLSQWKSWVAHEIWDKVKMGAYPSKWATQMYMGYVLFSFVLAYVMPGPVVEGLPIPSLNGKKLKYLCNGLSSWYLTLAVSFVCHVTGVFRLSGLIDHFGELMTVAIIWGFTMSTLVYVISVAMNKTHRMSGNVFYDYFMGACLNPRIGKVDLKMWAEIRLPWPVLFYLSLSCLLKQYETYGKITAPAFFMVLAHFFWAFTTAIFTLLLVGYYIFDTGNSQKNRFRMEQNGSFITRNAFPQLPWGHIKNPSFIRTKHGNLLLTSGWWGLARKPHYTADLMMAISWGLITGFSSFLPYFYFCFFLFVLVHRVSRDMERCANKYGQDWVEYCRRVPYIFIPYVF
ncbi:hypothetical protein MBANPS3_002740 [Mucor bainieri]